MKRIEFFTAEPPCPGCIKLLALADEIAQDYKGKVEVIKHIGPCEQFSKYKLTVVPAVVVESGLIRIMGLCPDKETITAALKEAGV